MESDQDELAGTACWTVIKDREEQIETIQFSDDEYSEDDENACTLRCRFDDEDELDDERNVLPNFHIQRLIYGRSLDADEIEVENDQDEAQRYCSACSLHSGRTNEKSEDERKRTSLTQTDQMLLSPKKLIINNNYYGVSGLQIGDHNTYRQQISRVSVLTVTGIYK